MKMPTAPADAKASIKSTGPSETNEAPSKPTYKEKMQTKVTARKAKPKMKK